jgi:regulatory protein
MPRVTALHPEPRDRVRVDLDGRPWRTFPTGAVVSVGLIVGTELDRPRARELRRAMRRSDALDKAAAALSRRDRSAAGLAAVLERRGVAEPERLQAVQTLSTLGYVDDVRFANERAASLARRGMGDEAIRFDLEQQGVHREQVESALGVLEPEAVRARQLAAGSESAAKTARRLAGKGFSAESIESVVGILDL